MVKGTQEIFLKKPNPDGIIKLFDKHGNRSDLIFNLGIRECEACYHAISVKAYNPETQTITIVNPGQLGFYKEIPLKDLAPDIVKIWVTNV